MDNTMRRNTDAGTRGGVARSNEVDIVMRVERRGDVILPMCVVILRG